MNLPRHTNDGNVYTFGSQLYLTNLKNSLSMNLKPRIKQFLKNYQQIYGLTDDQRVVMLYKIAGWTVPSTLTSIIINDQINEEIKIHRQILNLEELTESYTTNKKNLLPILNYYIYRHKKYL